jgi:hypothetical protein
METLSCTKEKWSANNIILLGDVFYSKNAIKVITRPRKDLKFYGKVGRSKFGRSPYGEIYGFTFTNAAAERLTPIIDQACELASNGLRCNLWDLYHTITSLPYNSGKIDNKSFHIISDHTDDFDKPEEYEYGKSIYNTISGPFSINKFLFQVKLYINKFNYYSYSKEFNGYTDTSRFTT